MVLRLLLELLEESAVGVLLGDFLNLLSGHIRIQDVLQNVSLILILFYYSIQSFLRCLLSLENWFFNCITNFFALLFWDGSFGERAGGSLMPEGTYFVLSDDLLLVDHFLG